MKKGKKALAAIGVALLFGGTLPIVPEEMKAGPCFAGPYLAQFAAETAPPPGIPYTPGPKHPEYNDEDGNGMISWCTFADQKGNIVFVQVPDTQYEKMGSKPGVVDNPKESEYMTLFESMGQEADAAIAFDTVFGAKDGSGAVTSVTYAHYVTSTTTNPFITVINSTVTSNGDTITTSGATYAGAAMTMSDEIAQEGTCRVHQYQWVKAAPATGANNVVVTLSGVDNTCNKQIGVVSLSYTGADQVTQPDSHGENSAVAPTTNFPVTTTVVAANTWLSGASTDDGGSIDSANAPGAQTVYRRPIQFNNLGADSNTTVGTGSQAINFGLSVAGLDVTGTVISINPAAAATAPPTRGSVILFE